MKVLVIGNGGREHALIYALSRHAGRDLQIYCAPGNAGIATNAQILPINALNITELAQYAQVKQIDLTIAGGETSLAAGVFDRFAAKDLPLFGPTQAAARLESSKIFAKDFMSRHKIPTARYRVAESPAVALKILESGFFGDAAAPVVVKADGLAAGKGVILANNRAAAIEAISELMRDTQAAQRVVLEETLSGREVSLLLFSDGRDYALMPAARDHKRIGENDTGPNTGGMGVITAPHLLDEATQARVVREIVEPTLSGAAAEGFPFRGILFLGLMLTAAGPQLLEYNVRFGDPEAQAILVRLESNLLDICEAVTQGRLAQTKVVWSKEASACVVLAAKNYPAQPATGAVISGLEKANQRDGTVIFHAGTTRNEAGAWLTAGGRVLGVTATGADLPAALRRAYAAVGDISWAGMQYRRDIGQAS